jgi:Tfp pilus assembly protein PilX
MVIRIHPQRGATLLVTLIMLVVLTLFAVAGFNLSSVNLKIAGNFQNQRLIEASVFQALEQVISSSTSFTVPPAPQTIAVNGINVAVATPVCYHSSPASGYEGNLLPDGTYAGPEDNIWEVRGTGTDALTGAQASLTQGLRVRMLPGNCP